MRSSRRVTPGRRRLWCWPTSGSLSSSWNVHPDRVTVDLNRTILYVKQQFGASVGSVWLFGAGAQARLSPMQTTLRLPVKLSPVQQTPFYWNHEALRLPVEDSSN